MTDPQAAAVPAAPATPPYAGFWIRFFAVWLDGFVLGIPIVWVAWRSQFHGLHAADRALLYLLPMTYVIGFWAWRGATPGKMALGLRIVRADDGAPMRFWHCVGRYFSRIFSSLPLGLGYAWVGWDPRKRGFHDHIARTVVLRDREPIAPVGLLAALAVGSMIVLFVGGVGLGVYWAVRNASGLKEKGEALKAEARTFAQGRTAEQCRDEGLRRVDACDGIFCEAGAKVFFTECAGAAGVTPVFCAGVPPRSQILASALWANQECARLGRTTPPCTRFIQAVPQLCSAPPPPAPPASPATKP